MEFINILIIIAFVIFALLEGRSAIKAILEQRKLIKKLQEDKHELIIIKDYMKETIVYAILAGLILAYCFVYYSQQQYLFAGVFAIMPLFCIIFILEATVNRTIVFYESGFLYATQLVRYKSVLKIDDKKKFIRGYHVVLINDDDRVYVTKKGKEVLENQLKEFKERKKHKHEK